MPAPVPAARVFSGAKKGVNNKLSKPKDVKKHPHATALPFTDATGNVSLFDDESDLVSEFIYRQDDESTLQLSHSAAQLQLQQDEDNVSLQQSQDYEHITDTHWSHSHQQHDDNVSLMTDCRYQLPSVGGEGHDNNDEDDDRDDENATHAVSLQQNFEPIHADALSAIPSLDSGRSAEADTAVAEAPPIQLEQLPSSLDNHSDIVDTHSPPQQEAPRLLSSTQLSTRSSGQLTSQLSKQFSEPFPLLSMQFSSRSILNELDTKLDTKHMETKINSLSLVSEEEFVEMASPRGSTHTQSIDQSTEETATVSVQLNTVPVTV